MPGSPTAGELVDCAASSMRTSTAVSGRPGHFDARRFELLYYCEDRHYMSVSQIIEEWLTGVATWAGYRVQSGGKGAIGSSTLEAYVDSMFTRCVEKCSYQARLASLMGASQAKTITTPNFSLSVICSQ